MDDENASQSSAPGFNSDLSKLNRIFEIRENILKNNKSLNSLYYMFTTALFFVFGAGIFSIVFFIIYKNTDKTLNKLDTLQSHYYIVENGLMQIISSCLSLLALIDFSFLNQTNLKYNSYIEDQNEYFELLINKNINWTDDTTTKLILIERYFSEFGNADYFWRDINVTYPEVYFNENDTESFPISLTRCLVDASTLLHDLNYTRNISLINDEKKYEIFYLSFESIYNSFDFIIPVLIKYNKYILQYIKEKNNSKINAVWYLNAIYLIFVCLCFVVYLWQLMVTNNYLGQGLEKLVKISQDKIDEIILKVKNFTENFKNNIENEKENTINNKEESSESFEEEEEKIEKKNTEDIKKPISNNQKVELKRRESEFNLDIKQNKKLNLQNTSYVHLTIIFLVCISACFGLFIISHKVISNNIQIMEVQTYIFGRFSTASCLTVKLKCILSKCNVNNTLDCNSFINNDLKYTYYTYLSNYPLLNEFYNKNFLLNACGAVFDYETEEYKNCLNDEMVILINNTDAFIDMLTEKIDNLIYEYDSNSNLNDNYPAYEIFSSNNYYVMEKIYYEFIIPVIDRLDNIVLKSVNDELKKKKKLAIIVILLLICSMIIFINYVVFIFLRKLVYFLNISKCVVKIIPCTIISTNPDLENWLEKINNKN